MEKGWISKKLEMIKLLLTGSLLSSSQAEFLPFVDEIVMSLLLNLVTNEGCILVSVPSEHIRNARKTLEQIAAIVFGFTTTTATMDSSFIDLPSAFFMKNSSSNNPNPSPYPLVESTSPATSPTGALLHLYRNRRRPWLSEINQQRDNDEIGPEGLDLDVEDYRNSRSMSQSASVFNNHMGGSSNMIAANRYLLDSPVAKINDSDSVYSKTHGRLSNSNFQSFRASRDSSVTGGLSSPISVCNLLPTSGSTSGKKLPNAVILEGLQNVDATIQAALLEILVTQQVKDKGIVYNLPDLFIIIAVVPISDKQLNIMPQLLDRIFLRHSNEGPLPKLASHSLNMKTIISLEELRDLRFQATKVYIHHDVSIYIRDIIVALRNQRLVQTGVTALASRHLSFASGAIAAVLGYNIVTPAHVSMVCGSVLAHRLQLAHLWPYATEEIREQFKEIQALDIVENVMSEVPLPY